MRDAPHRPEEQAFKRIEEQRQAERQRELERKIAEAEPASGGASFKPEPASENERLKLAVADKRFEPAVEAESRVSRASDNLRAGEERVDRRVGNTEVTAWRPDASDKQVIKTRVERNFGSSRETEGRGVESTVRYLEKTGEYTDFVRLGGPSNPDVLCLGSDGKLCVVECKGHEVQAKDSGYTDANGDKAGTLATETKDGVFYENEREWLLKNKSSMEERLRSKIDDPATEPSERASCQRLSEVLKHTNLREWNSHHRLVGIAGPEASFGNIEDYVAKVRPEKMIQIRTST
jgi:hypothetical protein